MDLAGAVAVEVRADLDPLEKGFDKARASTEKFDKTVNGATQRAAEGSARWSREHVNGATQAAAANDNFIKSTGGISGAMNGAITAVKAFAVAAVAAFSVNAVISAADTYTEFTNRLKLAGLEGQSLAAVQDRLFESANRNGVAIEAVGQLYGRASLNAKELGVSQEELLQFTDGVTAAIKLQGGSAAESSGALLQLSQALGAGVVRAEEFNSILEGAPEIARAAARGLEETGGSVAKLRTLVLEGKVSSTEFFEALQKGFVQTKDAANGMGLTVGAAMTSLSNSFTRFIGALNEATGATSTLAQILVGIGSVLDTMRTVITAVSAALAPYIEYINAAGVALVAAFGPTIIGYMVTLATTITTQVIAAFTALTAVILANPLGALAVAITGVIALLYQWRDEIEIVGEWFDWLADKAKKAIAIVKAALQSVGFLNPGTNEIVINADKAAEQIKNAHSTGGEDAAKATEKALKDASKTGAETMATGITESTEAAAFNYIPPAFDQGGQQAAQQINQGMNQGAIGAGDTIFDAMARGANVWSNAAQGFMDAIVNERIRLENNVLRAQADLMKAEAAALEDQQLTASYERRGLSGGGYGTSGNSTGNTSGGVSYVGNGLPDMTGFTSGTLGGNPVSSSGSGSSGSGGSGGVSIINVSDPAAAVAAVGTVAGKQEILNFMTTNADEVKQILGVA